MKEMIESDKNLLRTKSKRFFMLYGINYNGSRCYFSVSYNHSTRPEFHSAVIDSEGKVQFHPYSPRFIGVTKKNNWSIDPEWINGDW